jgi:hypothetical protein
METCMTVLPSGTLLTSNVIGAQMFGAVALGGKGIQFYGPYISFTSFPVVQTTRQQATELFPPNIS